MNECMNESEKRATTGVGVEKLHQWTDEEFKEREMNYM
jgi:hypothetical protein